MQLISLNTGHVKIDLASVVWRWFSSQLSSCHYLRH